MRKHSLLLLVAAVWLTACQKNEAVHLADTAGHQTITKVNNWLTEQGAAGQNATIEKIKKNLDYTQLRFEDLRDGEKFIIVPLKQGFQSRNNSDQHPVNVLLLIENKSGGIRMGNIAQYIPATPQAGAAIPVNSFFNIFNAEPPGMDAQFSFLTLGDRLAYQVTYKDGAMQSSGTAKPGSTIVNSPPQAPISPQPVCTDWYLVTTYYYADGHTEQTEQYLYTICEPNGGGGASGNEVEYEFEKSQEENWTVYPGPIGAWGVYALDKLKGRKNAGEDEGGHFTGITNIAADCIRCASYSVIWNWDYQKTGFSGQTAWCHIKGHLSTPINPDIFIDKKNTYHFKDVFN